MSRYSRQLLNSRAPAGTVNTNKLANAIPHNSSPRDSEGSQTWKHFLSGKLRPLSLKQESLLPRGAVPPLVVPNLTKCKGRQRYASKVNDPSYGVLDGCVVPSIQIVDDTAGWKSRCAEPELEHAWRPVAPVVSRTQLDMFVSNKSCINEKDEDEKDSPLFGASSRRKPMRHMENLRRRAARVQRKKAKQLEMLKRISDRVAVQLLRMQSRAPQLGEQFALVDDHGDQLLGQGRQGIVRRGIDVASKTPVAVKTCPKGFRLIWTEENEDIGSVRHEIETLKRLRPHPNLLNFRASFESPVNIHIVTELCSGGDLFSFLNNTEFEPQLESDASRVVAKLLDVINACHTQGCTHLDVKLENIMRRKDGPEIDSGDIVLVDFGHCRPLPDPSKSALGGLGSTLPREQLTRPVGSPSYAAPEVVLKCEYNERSDMWSIGIVTYVLLHGYLPFPHLQLKRWRDFTVQDYSAPSNSPFRFEEDWHGLSPECLDFCKRTLTVDPEHRISFEDALKHPWIKEQKSCSKQDHGPGKSDTDDQKSFLSSIFG